MAQVSHFGPFTFFDFDFGGLPPGGQHVWSISSSPTFLQSGLVATAHPQPEGIDTTTGVERRLTVSMIQSGRNAADVQFVEVFLRNVGSQPVHWYELWLSVIHP